MDGRRARHHQVALRDLPRIPARRGRFASGSRERVERLGLLALWPAVIMAVSVIEPAPANPNAAPVLGAVLITMLLLGIGATAVLAATAPRIRAAKASVITGVIGLAGVITCPAVGHHHLAPWWFAELSLFLAATLWSAHLTRRA